MHCLRAPNGVVNSVNVSPHAAAFESRCVWCTTNDVALARERPYLVPSRACLPRGSHHY